MRFNSELHVHEVHLYIVLSVMPAMPFLLTLCFEREA